MITQHEISELVNLYHAARTALSGKDDSKYAQMCWATKEFSKSHPDIPPTRAYKALDERLHR